MGKPSYPLGCIHSTSHIFMFISSAVPRHLASVTAALCFEQSTTNWKIKLLSSACYAEIFKAVPDFHFPCFFCVYDE